MKSFILFWICNKSVVEAGTIGGSLRVDYMSYADPVVRVSFQPVLRCSQTPHKWMWGSKKFLVAKMIHLCTRIFYSSYAEFGVATLSNSYFVSVADELLHLHLLFLRKLLFDLFFFRYSCCFLVVLVQAYLLEALLCRRVLAPLVTVAWIPYRAQNSLRPVRTLT